MGPNPLSLSLSLSPIVWRRQWNQPKKIALAKTSKFPFHLGILSLEMEALICNFLPATISRIRKSSSLITSPFPQVRFIGCRSFGRTLKMAHSDVQTPGNETFLLSHDVVAKTPLHF